MTTDLQLQHRVAQELEWEPRIDAAQIGVAVRDGIVTLTGPVSSYIAKLTAERAAKRVHGVREIANHLVVDLTVDCRRTDADITAAAERALDWHAFLPRQKIEVMVSNGHLRLGGAVSYRYQRIAAKSAVSHLIGVRSVTNAILIQPPTNAGIINKAAAVT